MKLLPLLSIALFPAFNCYASDHTNTSRLIASLEATQSFGSKSNPVHIRTLDRWDISAITENIVPNSSSDGKAKFSPEAVACLSFSMKLDQEKARATHREIIQASLSRNGLNAKQRQKLLTEQTYLKDYKYRILCEGAKTELAELKYITGLDPEKLKKSITESNLKFSSKPAPKIPR